MLESDNALQRGAGETNSRALVCKEGDIGKEMFGGISFLLNGNMVAGVLGDEMIVRFAPEDTSRLLKESYTRPFDPFNKHPKKVMQGWILVGAKAVMGKPLKKWLDIGMAYAGSLPQKTAKKKTAKRQSK